MLILALVFSFSSVILDVVLRIRIFKFHTHQDTVHLQIFYKGMLNYLAQETVDQMLPRLNDLLQINGEKTISTEERLQLNLGLSFMEFF